MVPTGKESFKKRVFCCVCATNTVYASWAGATPIVSSSKTACRHPRGLPGAASDSSSILRLEYLLQIVSQNSILVQGLVKTPVLRYALDR